jgi:hypothetical protein
VIDSFLESALLAACPALRDEWSAVRRTYRDGSAPDEERLFTHVRLHVVGLLIAGRFAEFTRFARSLERLLGDADPVLHDLLRDRLVRPLAREVEEAGVAHSRVEPHLGPRMRVLWHSGA